MLIPSLVHKVFHYFKVMVVHDSQHFTEAGLAGGSDGQ